VSANGPDRRRRAWLLISIFEASNNGIWSKHNPHFCIAQMRADSVDLAPETWTPVFGKGRAQQKQGET
jgi:hypothetical protein